MSKRIKIIVCIILLSITLLASFNTIKIYRQKKEIKNYLEYINSDMVEHRMETPEFMHVVLSAYKGDASGLNILKSIEYYTCDIIPRIKKNCTNKSSSKRYYNSHKIELEKELGVNNFNEFYDICVKCNNINNADFLEKTWFDTNKIEKTSNGLKCVLYYKYCDSDEISFNITISNSVYSDKGFIIIR